MFLLKLLHSAKTPQQPLLCNRVALQAAVILQIIVECNGSKQEVLSVATLTLPSEGLMPPLTLLSARYSPINHMYSLPDTRTFCMGGLGRLGSFSDHSGSRCYVLLRSPLLYSCQRLSSPSTTKGNIGWSGYMMQQLRQSKQSSA